MTTHAQLARAQAVNEQLKAERDYAKNMEARMAVEKESLIREIRSQNLITTSLQAIQVC